MIGYDVGGGGWFVGLFVFYDGWQCVLVGGWVWVNVFYFGFGIDGVLRGMVFFLGVDFFWRVKFGGGDFEGVCEKIE